MGTDQADPGALGDPPKRSGAVTADDTADLEASREGEYEQVRTRSTAWRAYEWVGTVFYPLRKVLGLSYKRSFERTLVAAEISTEAELYVSAALGVGVLVGLLAGVMTSAGLTLGVGLALAGSDALIVAAGSLSAAGTATLGTYGVLTYYPRSVASRRERAIELGMSDLVSFMYTLSVSGMNIVEVFEAAADADTEYGEASREFQRLVQRMNYLSVDYRTAMEYVRETTPSDEFSQFLTDLLSVLDSGGDIQTHLEREKETYLEEAERAQEEENERIELLGNVYMVAKLAPILLVVLYVVIMFTGRSNATPIAVIVYGLMPTLTAGYFVLLSTITADRVGDGTIELAGREQMPVSNDSMLSTAPLDSHAEQRPDLFEAARAREQLYAYRQVLRNPVAFWKERPTAVLAVTVPITVGLLGALVVAGVATVSVSGFIADHTKQTLIWVYLPAVLNLTPLALFYEWNERDRRAIKETLTTDLRKLAEANRYSDNLRDAFAKVGRTGDSRLSDELGQVETNLAYGIPMEASLVELTNRYEEPRFARTMKIIQKAQEADQQISEVIDTAANLSQITDQLEADRQSRTSQQATIIGFSFFVFIILIMIMMTFFQPLVTGAAEGSSDRFLSLGVDPDLMGTLYLHALVVDAIGTGIVSGYIRDLNLSSSFKFVLLYLGIALLAWLGIPPLVEASGLVPSV